MDRLNRQGGAPRSERSEDTIQNSPSPVSKESHDFWKKYFQDEEAAAQKEKKLNEENKSLKKELKAANKKRK